MNETRRVFILSCMATCVASKSYAWKKPEWLKNDLEKFRELRNVFPEYGDLTDLEFAKAMKGRALELEAEEPDLSDSYLTLFRNRLPSERESSRSQLLSNIIKWCDAAIETYSN